MTGTEKPKEEIQFPYMLEDDGFEMGATEGEGGVKSRPHKLCDLSSAARFNEQERKQGASTS